MAGYKEEYSLNERDSLEDMLITEKSLLKTYASVFSESVSKGFRETVRSLLLETSEVQLKVFLLMTELDFYRVASAGEEDIKRVRENFYKKIGELN